MLIESRVLRVHGANSARLVQEDRLDWERPARALRVSLTQLQQGLSTGYQEILLVLIHCVRSRLHLPGTETWPQRPGPP